MHWLPLVAMVIASALPFPHVPMARNIATPTDPGRHLGGRTADQDDARSASRGALSNEDNMTPMALLHRPDGLNMRPDTDPSDPAPLLSDPALLQSDPALLHSNPAPLYSDPAPLHSDPAPLHSDPAPLHSDPAPLHSDSAPLHSDSAPLHSDSAPLHSDPAPLHSDPAPLYSDPALLRSDASFDSNSEAERGQFRTSVSTSRTDYISQDKGVSEDYKFAEGVEQGLWGGMEVLQGDELFLDAHPRVLFSPSPSPPGHPPLLLLESGMLEEEEQEEEQQHQEEEEVWDADQHIEGHGDREPDRDGSPHWAESPPRTNEGHRPVVRNKRSPSRMREQPVCDMESVWVMDKKMAIDSHGRNVTILPVIQTLTGPLQQYFYETRCRQLAPVLKVAPQGPGTAEKSPEPLGVAGGTCRGVDKKQWTSQCKARQSYVRALTKDSNNRTGWRWIRIDSSCVCVLLSPANRRGRGVEGWRGG